MPRRRVFTSGYGVAWFLGSAIIGFLYDVSISVAVVFCLDLQLVAIPVFLRVTRLAGKPFTACKADTALGAVSNTA